MAHTPVNHPLRPLYRALSFVAGAYLVVFGVIGLIQTSGESFTGASDVRVLGQGTNMLWSILAVVLGAIVLATAAIGRNLDVEANKYLGWGILVVGSYELATSRTDANFFGFTIATVVVTYLVGLVLITAGLYLKVAPQSEAGAPRQVREGRTA
uniref:DUF4383 domain-containing protein n=1 Tax=Paractinoplanes polyasparticus TaxID=2856853 RepID=UPI001C85E24D|nr:DUF4383 domain-containing protein [Actinoplanes polyasparticus]